MNNTNIIVDITEKAIGQVLALLVNETNNEEKGLRLSVIGGGCSGLSYKIDFDAPKEKDNVYTIQNIKVIVDPKSAIYLKGVTLDFQDGLNGKGFVFHNPTAKNTCGCGESFSI
jgi:iron-sulfur cluster assembly protein